MTATDTIRAMLDERGVEWREPNNMARSHTTYWTAGFLRCVAVEFNDGMVSVASSSDDITPEQAIEATLGRGECHVESVQQDCNMTRYGWVCDRCHGLTIGFAAPHFCSVCGRKVRA